MKFILICICLLSPFFSYAQTEPKELVIEMYEKPDTKSHTETLSIWDKNTAQLIRALRGKTREQALYQIPHVSTKDRMVYTDTSSYAVVEYTQKDEFRKLLFKGKDPQTFITAAGTVADVLAINKKYAINISVAQTAFEQAYASKYTVEEANTLPVYMTLYSLPYTDINTPQAQTVWFLFDNKTLVKTFYSSEEKENYLQRFRPGTQTLKTNPSKPASKPVLHKALVSGGTTWDQMYMPRVVFPKTKTTSAVSSSEKE